MSINDQIMPVSQLQAAEGPHCIRFVKLINIIIRFIIKHRGEEVTNRSNIRMEEQKKLCSDSSINEPADPYQELLKFKKCSKPLNNQGRAASNLEGNECGDMMVGCIGIGDAVAYICDIDWFRNVKIERVVCEKVQPSNSRAAGESNSNKKEIDPLAAYLNSLTQEPPVKINTASGQTEDPQMREKMRIAHIENQIGCFGRSLVIRYNEGYQHQQQQQPNSAAQVQIPSAAAADDDDQVLINNAFQKQQRTKENDAVLKVVEEEIKEVGVSVLNLPFESDQRKKEGEDKALETNQILESNASSNRKVPIQQINGLFGNGSASQIDQKTSHRSSLKNDTSAHKDQNSECQINGKDEKIQITANGAQPQNINEAKKSPDSEENLKNDDGSSQIMRSPSENALAIDQVQEEEIKQLDIDMWEVKFPDETLPTKIVNLHEVKDVNGPNSECNIRQQTTSASYRIKMHPFFIDAQGAKTASRGYLEITFTCHESYQKFKAFLVQICVIAEPTVDQDYIYVDKLGQGSQASVDLYKSRKITSKIPAAVTVPAGTNTQEESKSATVGPAPALTQSPIQSGAEMKKYAVKKYKIGKEKSSIERDLIVNEINFLRELRMCDNIVKLEAVYCTWDPIKKEKNLQLVMKYAPYGSILKYLQKRQKFTEEQIRTVMAQLLLAIDLMHRKGIIHRDIKPDNILIMDRKELKICISDLGLACKADDETECKLKCGTPGYVAPEVLKGAPFSAKTDIFSVGSFFFNMLTCSNLFMGRNGKEMLIANKYQNPFSAVQMKVANVSPECKQLLLQMLSITGEQRPTAEQCITHNWFQKDREALQNSLFINKNQQLIATLFNQPQFGDVQHMNSCESFVIAPNYYELVQCLSSQGSLISGTNSAKNSQIKIASGYARGNSSIHGGGTVEGGGQRSHSHNIGINMSRNEKNPFQPSFEGSPMVKNDEVIVQQMRSGSQGGGDFSLKNNQLSNAYVSGRHTNTNNGGAALVNIPADQNTQRKGSVCHSPANVRFCYNQMISRGRQASNAALDAQIGTSQKNAGASYLQSLSNSAAGASGVKTPIQQEPINISRVNNQPQQNPANGALNQDVINEAQGKNMLPPKYPNSNNYVINPQQINNNAIMVQAKKTDGGGNASPNAALIAKQQTGADGVSNINDKSAAGGSASFNLKQSLPDASGRSDNSGAANKKRTIGFHISESPLVENTTPAQQQIVPNKNEAALEQAKHLFVNSSNQGGASIAAVSNSPGRPLLSSGSQNQKVTPNQISSPQAQSSKAGTILNNREQLKSLAIGASSPQAILSSGRAGADGQSINNASQTNALSSSQKLSIVKNNDADLQIKKGDNQMGGNIDVSNREVGGRNEIDEKNNVSRSSENKSQLNIIQNSQAFVQPEQQPSKLCSSGVGDSHTMAEVAASMGMPGQKKRVRPVLNIQIGNVSSANDESFIQQCVNNNNSHIKEQISDKPEEEKMASSIKERATIQPSIQAQGALEYPKESMPKPQVHPSSHTLQGVQQQVSDPILSSIQQPRDIPMPPVPDRPMPLEEEKKDSPIENNNVEERAGANSDNLGVGTVVTTMDKNVDEYTPREMVPGAVENFQAGQAKTTLEVKMQKRVDINELREQKARFGQLTHKKSYRGPRHFIE